MTSPATSPLQTLIETAQKDLAQRLSIPVAMINLIEAKAVTWSDSSLGCPQEGIVYAEVLTLGYRVILEYAKQTYEYHAGKGHEIFYCANPIPPVVGIPDNT